MGYVLMAMYYLVLLAVVAVGLVLIVGSLRNYPALVKPDEVFGTYTLLGKFCPICIKILHIFVGIVFCAVAIAAMFHPHANF